MNLLGNLIWLIFGGIIIAIEYFIGSLILMITIVGIPFGIQTLKMGALALWPFGRDTRVDVRASGNAAFQTYSYCINSFRERHS